MRRQPPIVRCFIVLCFSSAVTLAAFEWRDPFPKAVVTPLVTPSADAILNLDGSKGGWLKARNNSKTTIAERSAPLGRWFGARHRGEAMAQPPYGIAQDSTVELRLSLASRTLDVRVPGKAPVLYEVAVGQDDWQTPTGKFTVINKIENPAWKHPITHEEIPAGDENPLGTRWIGFWTDGTAQIGFHGTNQEELIGEAVSHGCVRMRNSDIEALFQQVEVGTVVTVTP
jgi:L,D-transpeptidase ErfK/SrfK